MNYSFINTKNNRYLCYNNDLHIKSKFGARTNTGSQRMHRKCKFEEYPVTISYTEEADQSIIS